MRTLSIITVGLFLTSLPASATAQSREAALAAVMKLPQPQRQAAYRRSEKGERIGLVFEHDHRGRAGLD